VITVSELTFIPLCICVDLGGGAKMLHDATYTTVASVLAGMLEIGMCHLWATGKVAYQHDMMATPISNVLWIITITHWRIPHFWVSASVRVCVHVCTCSHW
jgi:hypothetical protein